MYLKTAEVCKGVVPRMLEGVLGEEPEILKEELGKVPAIKIGGNGEGEMFMYR